MPAVELVMMIDPPLPALIIAGIAALRVFQTPVRLTAIVSSQTSSSIVQAFSVNVAMPALALTMSRRPSPPGPLLDHGGQHSAHGVEDAGEVGVDHVLPGRFVQFRQNR